MNDRFLVLADGEIYKGKAFGAKVSGLGRLVFNTVMTGHPRVLADPVSFGQIVLQTFPIIGACGVSAEEYGRKIHLSGYVVNEYCDTPSNFRAAYTLDAYLKKYDVPGISGVDTRALTKRLSEKGAVNALLCDKVPEDMPKIQDFKITNALESTASGKSRLYPGKGEKPPRAVLLDYGAAEKIISVLRGRGFEVAVYPYFASAEEIRGGRPDILVLSDGAGDPREHKAQISVVSELLGEYPVLGIGLGQEIFVLAAGGGVYELKNGHRGANVPVMQPGGGTFITAQNRTFAVSAESLGKIGGAAAFVNVNDGSLAGAHFPARRAFTVCFCPEDAAAEEGISPIINKIFPESRCDTFADR